MGDQSGHCRAEETPVEDKTTNVLAHEKHPSRTEQKIEQMTPDILFISGGEIILVMLVALLFFGSKAIPDIAKTLGKGMREFRKATNEIKRELEENTSDIKKDIREMKSTIDEETKKIGQDIEQVSHQVTEKTTDISNDLEREFND